MLTSTDLAALKERIPSDPDLGALLDTIISRSNPLIASIPHIPRVKALLSKDGGFCPSDGSTLTFDPWSPQSHRCPRCGESFSGERHYLNWARAQHLWLAERMAELALVGLLRDDQRAIARAIELLDTYVELYLELPNRDNVLGPTHLFFSTYLESIWINSFLTAAYLLREAGLLNESRIESLNAVADEAANLIAEFNERFSNRQTWAAAALAAIAVWFDDEELARTAVEDRTGLLGHLADGFGSDGLWWEGENYHLFALRGLMQGMQWAHAMGYDILGDPVVRDHFRLALLGPTLTALPDATYPARRDSRYGVSLAQPSSLDLWEIGRSWLGGDDQLDRWLTSLYTIPGPLKRADHNDFWLHHAGHAGEHGHSRSSLSWWALMSMVPLPEIGTGWQGESTMLEGQGLAVLRHEDLYASLECGSEIGGHGHPDRLNLTFFANGIHWLPDQGTGSYVHETLAWYRSAMAHNAPIVDGVNAGGADAWCQSFDSKGKWHWCRGVAGECKRTVVSGPALLVDMVELEGASDRVFELPWHYQGEISMLTEGAWGEVAGNIPFVTRCERFVARDASTTTIQLTVTTDEKTLNVMMLVPGAEVFRYAAPGLPFEKDARRFLLLRATTNKLDWTTVIECAGNGVAVTATDQALNIVSGEILTVLQSTVAGISVQHVGEKIELGGARRQHATRPVVPEQAQHQNEAAVMSLHEPPSLDGSLEGWDIDAPLFLDSEEQYRRSEESYQPERVSATAYLNTDGEAFFLAVAVAKEELIFRPSDAQPLLLDNEADDVHSDGVEIFWCDEKEIRDPGSEIRGFLVVPQDDGALHVRRIAGGDDKVKLTGAWQSTEEGYLITLRLDDPILVRFGVEDVLRFDLLINEMQPKRLRRAGQLVWGGDGGWVYLRGDRHLMSKAGIVRLG